MRFVAVLVAACALWLTVSPGPVAAAPGVQFGIQDDAWLEHGPGTLSSRVATLDRLGLDVVRITLDWHRIEPRAGVYRWQRPDRAEGAPGGGSPVVTLWGTPAWANGGRGRTSLRSTRSTSRPSPPGRAPLPLRPALGGLERAEQGPVAPARVAATHVRQLLNPGYRGIKDVSPRALVAGGVTAPRGGQGGMSPVDFIHGMDVRGRASTPTRITRTPSTRATRRFSAAALQDDHDGDARTASSPRGRRVPACPRLADGVRIPDEPRPTTSAWRRLDQARYVAESARRVYAAPKVDMLIHYLYRDEPDLGRWQSGLETIDGRPKPALAATMLR